MKDCLLSSNSNTCEYKVYCVPGSFLIHIHTHIHESHINLQNKLKKRLTNIIPCIDLSNGLSLHPRPTGFLFKKILFLEVTKLPTWNILCLLLLLNCFVSILAVAVFLCPSRSQPKHQWKWSSLTHPIKSSKPAPTRLPLSQHPASFLLSTYHYTIRLFIHLLIYVCSLHPSPE